jgi:plasmid stabilization system protein ParE
MKKYKVILHPDAEIDISSSFQWGGRKWGRKAAEAWIRKLRHTINTRLTSAPLGCSLAPESTELDIDIRQLIVGRYRILFIVENRLVTVLHVKGSYVPQLSPAEEIVS